VLDPAEKVETMVERMARRTESDLVWAERTAHRLLAPLEARWRHTLRVVERAQSFRNVLHVDELEVLLAAAYLHDIGYAPELAEADFHPLDGARFVRDSRHERLAGLVAHHSASDAEAEERGLAEALAEFPAEDSLVACALTYSDLTTGPDVLAATPIRRIDFDDPEDVERHRRLVELVNQRVDLEAMDRTVTTAPERRVLRGRIRATEALLDEAVYALYGLTPSEIADVDTATAGGPAGATV
jgi:hypothetical protein